MQNSEVGENSWSQCTPEHRLQTLGIQPRRDVDSDVTPFRKNEVYRSRGESIGDLLSDRTTIEDNVVWDSYAVMIYLDNSRFTTVQRNIVYSTDNTAFWRYAHLNPAAVAGNRR